MAEIQAVTGLADIDNARIYYEIAGQGQPIVMIHAGVADSRQWNNEFKHFTAGYRVMRYDMRGFGKSEPVEGDFSHLQDLTALLDTLQINQPAIIMGCSMGGSLALDFALTQPSTVCALILLGAVPGGLHLDEATPAKLVQAEAAYHANEGNLDMLAELSTQVWFDGMGREPAQVDPAMRSLAYEMARTSLAHDAKRLGKRLPDSTIPAVQHLSEMAVPALIIVGEHDTPFLLAAADFMQKELPSAQKVIMDGAAHLANMDHPHELRRIVSAFLKQVAR